MVGKARECLDANGCHAPDRINGLKKNGQIVTFNDFPHPQRRFKVLMVPAQLSFNLTRRQLGERSKSLRIPLIGD
jgi:hypothetical protein